jgi:hypothetical protein
MTQILLAREPVVIIACRKALRMPGLRCFVGPTCFALFA